MEMLADASLGAPGPSSGFMPQVQGDAGKQQQQQRGAENSCCIKLKGLPYTASEQDVLSFFSGYAVKAVRFVYEPDGRPSGLAFAEFDSKDEALKALSKNGDYLGERYIRLLHVPKAEMEEQVRLGTLAVPGGAARLRNRLARQQQQQQQQQQGQPRPLTYVSGPVQLVSAVVPGVPGGRPVMAIAQPMGSGQPMTAYSTVSQLPMESRGWQPAGYQTQAVPFHGGQPQQMSGLGQQQHVGTAPGQYQPSPMQLASQLQGLSLGGAQAGMGRNTAPPQMMPPAITLQPPPAASAAAGAGNRSAQIMQPTSPIVKIRGLPYRSSPNDILTFFQGYSFIPDSLQIGLDQLGRPSGEAWLSFAGPQEALRAVRELNRHYLGNRYLELSIC